MTDRCEVPGCRREVEIIYLDRRICERHWSHFNADGASPDALRRALGIGNASPATEEPMEERETETATAEAAGTSPSAEPPTEESEEMAVKTREKRSTKKTGARRKGSVTKATKASKPKKAEAEDKPNRVFAIRVTDDELAAIHKAAGPRNATRFIRAVAAAFAADDPNAFSEVVKEAKQARS